MWHQLATLSRLRNSSSYPGQSTVAQSGHCWATCTSHQGACLQYSLPGLTPDLLNHNFLEWILQICISIGPCGDSDVCSDSRATGIESLAMITTWPKPRGHPGLASHPGKGWASIQSLKEPDQPHSTNSPDGKRQLIPTAPAPPGYFQILLQTPEGDHRQALWPWAWGLRRTTSNAW